MSDEADSIDVSPAASDEPRDWLIPVGIISFALIALFGILQFHDVQAGKRAVLAIEESNLRLRTVSDYLRVLQDIETGQRGFVVTGNPEFLEPPLRT